MGLVTASYTGWAYSPITNWLWIEYFIMVADAKVRVPEIDKQTQARRKTIHTREEDTM